MTVKAQIRFLKWAIRELDKKLPREISICFLYSRWRADNRLPYEYLLDTNTMPLLNTEIRKAMKRTGGLACINYSYGYKKKGRQNLMRRVINQLEAL